MLRFFSPRIAVLLCLFALAPLALHAGLDDDTSKNSSKTEETEQPKPPEDQKTQGSVNVEGHAINYDAVAGTILVGSTDEQDAAFGLPGHAEPKPDDANATASARMFYVAYFKRDEKPETRPITFLYNGGPGSSSVWLHMGAFGPKRVVTADDRHTPPAPYQLVDNSYSLLDASDLVFVDAPGTGFGRLYGKDSAKAFWGVDQDGKAFTRFITRFLSKYQRWNSPKFLFGESYGTTRSAVVANLLEADEDMDLNGVILLSQILNFDDSADSPQFNPGVDLPYELSLPSFAAAAYYHHKLPNPPAELKPFLSEVEHFALGDYAEALTEGTGLPEAEKHAIAEKLHDYTGLPVDYIERANLRINVGEFNINLQGADQLTTGRLDTRFSGPSFDPLAEEAAYDPQSAAISSAYVSAFNDYVRRQLGFGEGLTYIPESGDIDQAWEMKHIPPGANAGNAPGTVNVMPDLAAAMKYEPHMRVMLNAGYYDLATPFFAAVFEINHLPIQSDLRKNIQVSFYQSGHMVYAHEPALKELHDNVAAFIRGNYNPAGQ